jgi:hypothetical protein
MHALAGICWRLVEAQYHVSTLKLVDSVAEQELIENLIEMTKPPLPLECRDLHYLLSTPFRYGAVYPNGSRFRRAGMTEGVFYASETPQTAVAEMTFYRLRIHGLLSRIPHQESNRPDQGQIRRRQHKVDARYRLQPLPGARRNRANSQD